MTTQGRSVGVLLEAFRHHAWATRSLLAACGDLSSEQLSASATGTYGGILSTFNHLILADAGYLRAPTGTAPAWATNHQESSDLRELASRVDETMQLWERFIGAGPDAERVLLVDEGAYEVREGIVIVQALHHGNAHREQICTVLTALGIEPPDTQAWEFAWATGRIWERNGM
jgi:uncharacterized damage-inducible protein DinB